MFKNIKIQLDLMEIKKDTDTELKSTRDLLDSLSGGNATEYLNGVVGTINTAREKAKDLESAIILGKEITHYDYYSKISEEFSKIHNGISPNALLPAFGLSNEEIADLNKIKEKPLEERKPDILEVLKKLGVDSSKINFSDPQSIATEILGQVGNRIVSEGNFLKDSINHLYFKEINDMIKTIEEYAAVLVDINKLNFSQPINRIVIKALYEKAYENNKKVLIDAYETITHEKIDINVEVDRQKWSTYMREHHPILMECMVNSPRIDIAHSKYDKIDEYSSEKLLEMSVRNFITSIIGITAKTNNLAETFESNVKKINSFTNSNFDTDLKF